MSEPTTPRPDVPARGVHVIPADVPEGVVPPSAPMPETAPRPDVPDELRKRLLAADLTSHVIIANDGYASVVMHTNEQAADRALKVFQEWMLGTREEIAAREAEAAKRKPDDVTEICERAAPGEHERRVRERVAAETYETVTFDAARQQADDDPGHEDHCEWHINEHSYCSCRIWPAACAGVSIAAERIAKSARGES